MTNIESRRKQPQNPTCLRMTNFRNFPTTTFASRSPVRSIATTCIISLTTQFDTELPMAKDKKPRISGKDGADVALDAAKYPPVHIGASETVQPQGSDEGEVLEKLPARVRDQSDGSEPRQGSSAGPQAIAQFTMNIWRPTPDLASLPRPPPRSLRQHHVRRVRRRHAGQGRRGAETIPRGTSLMRQHSTLHWRSSPRRNCRSELEALIAVEIVATGFAGLRFLRQSQRHMTEDYISVTAPTPTS